MPAAVSTTAAATAAAPAWCWLWRCWRRGPASAHARAQRAGEPGTGHSGRVSEAPDGPPTLESLATASDGLQMDVPITQKRITAIVYHGGGTSWSR